MSYQYVCLNMRLYILEAKSIWGWILQMFSGYALSTRTGWRYVLGVVSCSAGMNQRSYCVFTIAMRNSNVEEQMNYIVEEKGG